VYWWLVEDWAYDALGQPWLVGVASDAHDVSVLLVFTSPERAQQFLSSEIAREPLSEYASGELAVARFSKEDLVDFVDQHPGAFVILGAPAGTPLSTSIQKNAVPMETFVDFLY
jgi:hypothetical protein